MISKEYNFSDTSSVSCRKTEYNVIQLFNYKVVNFKNSVEFGKFTFHNGLLIKESIIYFNGQKIYAYSDDNKEIKFISKYDMDYNKIIYEKFFPFSIEKEIIKEKDEILIDIYKTFIKYVVDVQDRMIDYGIK